jgi:hypothetical protein
VWDCAGHYGGLRDGYYINANMAIVFHTTNSETNQYIKDWRRVNPFSPIIIVKSFVDTSDGAIEENYKALLAYKDAGLPIYSISSKSCYGFDKPFLHAARHLMGHEDLVFVE